MNLCCKKCMIYPTPTGLRMTSSGVPIRNTIWRNLYCRKWNAVRVCHVDHARQVSDSIVTLEIVTFEQVISVSKIFYLFVVAVTAHGLVIIARKKCYSYTLCCKTGNTDDLSHAGNAWEPRFLPVFPYDLRITSLLCHTEKICDAETPTNV